MPLSYGSFEKSPFYSNVSIRFLGYSGKYSRYLTDAQFHQEIYKCSIFPYFFHAQTKYIHEKKTILCVKEGYIRI